MISKSGVRRCGKSTLVHQIMHKQPSSLYLNFDTPNLYGFEMNDFRVLDVIIDERKPEWLFFDEMQVVKGWEIYVRSKLEQGYYVVVTGSNSSMLSRELGTRLTGRHLGYSKAMSCSISAKISTNATLSCAATTLPMLWCKSART